MGNENTRSQYISKVSSSMTREKSDGSIQYKEIMKFKGYKRTKSDTASTSYNHIKNIRDNSSISINSELKTKEDLINIKTDKKDDRIPFKFEWKEGGNKVTITGSFLTNWTVYIDMVKNPETGFFEFNVNLTREVHQFKFIVDNVWKCSINYLTTNDGNGNVNNVIDLTNFISNEKEENNKNESEKNEKDKENDIDYLKRENEIKKKNNNEFNCCLLDEDDMNFDAPQAPPCYMKNFDINCDDRRKNIGKKKYLKFNEKNILSENNCYKKISKLNHVILNHCCSATKGNLDEKFVRASVSKRVKHKFVTIIYYKPKRNCYI